LSSRFDENDAIFIMENVFIPWEDVFIYRDPARVMSFFPGTGFIHGAMFQGCTRYAVKLDFIAGLLAKALRATGGDEARGNQVLLGEVLAWRHLFWSLSDSMANNPQPWNGDAVLPDLTAAHAYRVFGPESWPRIRDIVQKTVTSSLIYLPSSVRDFANPAINELLRRYVRGSHDIGHIERIKIMKLLWDAVGTEFAGRHELYERNYSGGCDDVRAQILTGAQRGGHLREMEAMVEQCMADYDANGWTGSTWVIPKLPTTPGPLHDKFVGGRRRSARGFRPSAAQCGVDVQLLPLVWRLMQFTQLVRQCAHKVRASDDADHLAVPHHWDPLDVLVAHEACDLTRRRIVRHGGHTLRHHGLHLVALFSDAIDEFTRQVGAFGQHFEPMRLLFRVPFAPAEQVALAEHADKMAGVVHHRQATDPTLCHQRDCFQERSLWMRHRHIPGHQVACGDRCFVKHDLFSFEVL
jgi:hypothetical protein